ncbi:tRNA-dihydrouridine(47) synthase [NAD(P)(+)]-like [Musa acuminata AAA Group]|uniref:tRNA-dihydrouridine(47) synthase [NAD(P)(+)]-like n=1 Tax=Musa acuminata AAA Group TaxID=214697 RepID=UPI0031D18D64
MEGAAPAKEGSESVGTLESEGATRPRPEDLVARAIAPVKAEYLRPPPSRSVAVDSGVEDGSNEKKSSSTNVVVKEKKSRRQLKRERKQEQKSTRNICPEVAKSGNADACPYRGNCRFNHDMDAYLAEKPPDLEGACPFVSAEEFCPYGITCRYASTHRQQTSLKLAVPATKSSEVNSLNKDLQKLLWKNKVSFPNADLQLKLLGLERGNGARANSGADHMKNHPENNIHLDDNKEMLCSLGAPTTCLENDCLDNGSISDDSRPLKKTKSQADKIDSSPKTKNFEESQDSCLQNGLEDVSPDNLYSSKDDPSLKPHAREIKLIDFRGKLYLAPLTTVGNLPFRRICKALGADITCGEMAMCTNLLQGQASEWALLRRHSSEDIFGVQICGAYPDTVARTVELIDRECEVDFIDINMGCPIDIVVNKQAGSALLTKPLRMKNIIQAASSTLSKPLTVKVRTGYFEGRNRIDSLVSDISNWGAGALTIHGRSRQQRYSKLADWDYIYECAKKAPESLQVLGNGDIFSYTDWIKHTLDCPKLSTCMIARGALIKPWIFTEIKEQRHWDISSGERFNILKDFVRFGLQHWGSDTKGVETTRHFLLEWLSYTYRYIPLGLLDVVPQRLNWRPPSYYGRDDLETLMASDSAADWIRISEMLLGKVPEGFTFTPKHKSNAYDSAENG